MAKRVSLIQRRKQVGLTQEKLADLLEIDRKTVRRWELGECAPTPETRPALATALALSLEQLAVVLEAETPAIATPRALPGSLLSCAPLGQDVLGMGELEHLHQDMRVLIELDNRYGADNIAGLAVQLFRSLLRYVSAGRVAPSLLRDFQAAAAELGEIAGWLLYDANQQPLMRAINHEARHLTHLSGDSSMELLLLQNMSMQACHLGQVADALGIATMVLEGRSLSPRLRALFGIRKARALALAGDMAQATDTLAQAWSYYGDGVRGDDPAWAWWISERELSFHGFMIAADGNDWSGGIRMVQESIELTPHDHQRGIYIRLACLLRAQVELGLWDEARQTIESLARMVPAVGSSRTVAHIHLVLKRMDMLKPAAGVWEGARMLGEVLCDAGYAEIPITPSHMA